MVFLQVLYSASNGKLQCYKFPNNLQSFMTMEKYEDTLCTGFIPCFTYGGLYCHVVELALSNFSRWRNISYEAL